jgi:hypothetical protein
MLLSGNVSLNEVLQRQYVQLTYIALGTEQYSPAQQYIFKLIKPGYMFQLHSHHQAYLQLFDEQYMLNAYAMWDPSSEAKMFTDGIRNINH